MKVVFVGAGPGDPGLLTVKARNILKKCRIIIYAGSLVSPDVMSLVPARAERHDSAVMSLAEIIDVCEKARDRDIDVVRLHSGDPSIYGAIREQMNKLDDLGIPYRVVPGVSAFQAAAAALAAELTAPEVSQTVILTRTSGRTPLPEGQELGKLAAAKATLCIFLSGHKIEDTVQTLVPHYGTDCPAAVVYHASWPDEKIIRGSLEDIAGKVKKAGLGRTSIILVGRALSRDIPPSRLYDAGFCHGFRGEKKT
ncbi:MAG: Cobalt-precorrin-4 C(11)-methyltransferase [Syntrophaceae bacterium PtaU1.Bin231]|nr:MAG: Cobalt-precorrin-4 C(11)-methyltransferase [Syntrophaceae bacterium PtaU1.Bin231]